MRTTSRHASPLAVIVIVIVAACSGRHAAAADSCKGCRGTAGGMTTPCGDTGCGPRYCGEKHAPWCPDPCDGCNRWRGCNGARANPEMLAPWQLPPGRGFRSGAELGYRPGPCNDCGPSGLLR